MVRIVPSYLVLKRYAKENPQHSPVHRILVKNMSLRSYQRRSRVFVVRNLIVYFSVQSQLTIVQGHLSIVNSTLIHPVLPLIATAGIERQVLLHSPMPNTPWASNLPLTPTTTRSLPNGGLTVADPSILRLLMRMNTIMEPDESMGEDARSIAYFDMYASLFFLLNAD